MSDLARRLRIPQPPDGRVHRRARRQPARSAVAGGGRSDVLQRDRREHRWRGARRRLLVQQHAPTRVVQAGDRRSDRCRLRHVPRARRPSVADHPNSRVPRRTQSRRACARNAPSRAPGYRFDRLGRRVAARARSPDRLGRDHPAELDVRGAARPSLGEAGSLGGIGGEPRGAPRRPGASAARVPSQNPPSRFGSPRSTRTLRAIFKTTASTAQPCFRQPVMSS